MKKNIYTNILANCSLKLKRKQYASYFFLIRKKYVKLFAFLKSFLSWGTIQKIIILFIVGLFIRLLVNNFLSEGILDELLILLLGGSLLPLKPLLNDTDLNMKIINDNMSLIKRPRDYIINNDYEIKERCKRKLQWIMFNQFDSKYGSYREFKEKWNKDAQLTDQIKNKYGEKIREYKIVKKTILWFINPKYRS
uniref:Uncharacterized protein n=1 Tax=Fusarium annulatum TaxID=48484 RepID=A0A6M4AYJ0_9HYPO|nr:hypothetical protein [Fusarium annulatum]